MSKFFHYFVIIEIIEKLAYVLSQYFRSSWTGLAVRNVSLVSVKR